MCVWYTAPPLPRARTRCTPGGEGPVIPTAVTGVGFETPTCAPGVGEQKSRKSLKSFTAKADFVFAAISKVIMDNKSLIYEWSEDRRHGMLSSKAQSLKNYKQRQLKFCNLMHPVFNIRFLTHTVTANCAGLLCHLYDAAR